MSVIYTQNDPSTLVSVFGIPAVTAPFDESMPTNARRSITCLPLATWFALASSTGSSVPYKNTGEVHQVMSALMLTDALSRSDF